MRLFSSTSVALRRIAVVLMVVSLSGAALAHAAERGVASPQVAITKRHHQPAPSASRAAAALHASAHRVRRGHSHRPRNSQRRVRPHVARKPRKTSRASSSPDSVTAVPLAKVASAERAAVAEALTAGTGAIQGTVTDHVAGVAASGLCVYLYTAAGAYASNGACTDATGAYTISDVAPGTYTVAVYDPIGVHPTTWYGGVITKASATTFSVSAGAVTKPIDVSVNQLTGIAGHVRDTATSGRVAGACVYATQTGGGTASYATCLTDGADTYAISAMAPGTYQLAFYDPAGLHPTVRTTATVTAGHMTTADGAMGQVTAIVGSIIDAANSAPVQNGCAMLYAPGGGYVSGSYRCTNAQGDFTIDGIPAGKYLLAYYDPSARFKTTWFHGKPDQRSASVVTVSADTITTAGAERVTTFGAASGIVRKADGSPASGVCVYADDLAGRYTGVGTCSDDAGKYTLSGLPAGDYKLGYYPLGTSEPTPYWYLQRSDELSATPVTVAGLATTSLKDMRLVQADDSTPPGAVTSVDAASENSGVHLSWVNPNEADFAGVTIRRAIGTDAPTGPTDGTAVGEVTTPGTTFDDDGLAPGQTYTYALFAHDHAANYAKAGVKTIKVVATSTARHECGTIGANASWSPADAPVYVLDCQVIVGPGVTLTIAPGTIVKGSAGGGLVVQGSLVGTGTAAQPTSFTSLRDDATGGDTNGDGSATGPTSGNWPGIATSPVGGAAAPSVTLDRVRVAYSQSGLSLDGTAVSVTNSTVDHTGGDAIDVRSPVGVPTVKGNTITSSSGIAIDVQSAGIDLGALNANSGSGNGLNGVRLINDTLAVQPPRFRGREHSSRYLPADAPRCAFRRASRRRSVPARSSRPQTNAAGSMSTARSSRPAPRPNPSC